MIIDEDVIWLNAARSALSEAGYDVQTVEALGTAWATVQNTSFDLILVDLKKAEQEASDFRQVAQLQIIRGGKSIVLFATELTSEKVSSLFGLGADDCLDKPYNMVELVTLVREQIVTLPTPSETSQGQEQQPSEQPAKVLIIEDEPDWSKRLARYLQRTPDRYALQSAGDYATARSMLTELDLDIVILDLRLIENSEDFQGMQLLELLRRKKKMVSVIVVSAYGTVAHVKDGFQLYNISAYLSKQSFNPDQFLAAVQRAVCQRQRET
jgi:DNA-binding response OmpR family regulator